MAIRIGYKCMDGDCGRILLRGELLIDYDHVSHCPVCHGLIKSIRGVNND